jgi:hypothetical protein
VAAVCLAFDAVAPGARLHRPGPSGTRTLGRILQSPRRSGDIPGSWRERVTQRLLTHPELRDLTPQHEIVGLDGAVIARPDFALVDVRVGIEYHSDQRHYGPRRGDRDRCRDLAASRRGWELIYLDAVDHRRPQDALDAVLEVVRFRRWLFGRTGA